MNLIARIGMMGRRNMVMDLHGEAFGSGSRDERTTIVGEANSMEKIVNEPDISINVLIIDNDFASLNLTVGLLRSVGFHINTATNLIDGLKRLDDNIPDLVLVADTLSEDEAVCARFYKLINIPVIIMGTDQSNNAWERAVKLGADAYIRKSIGKREMVARMKAVIRRYQGAAEISE